MHVHPPPQEKPAAGGDGEGDRPAELTGFLNELARGNSQAGETLMPYVYDELRVIAESYMRRQHADHTLQPTALVNEAYLKLFRPEAVGWNDRKHFFSLAAKAMRQLLVDHARRASRAKRGSGQRPQTLDEAFAQSSEFPVDLLDLNLALEELSRRDERQGRVVELRYFGGLDMEEVAKVMDVSKRTVEREWRAARAWLGHRLELGS